MDERPRRQRRRRDGRGLAGQPHLTPHAEGRPIRFEHQRPEKLRPAFGELLGPVKQQRPRDPIDLHQEAPVSTSR